MNVLIVGAGPAGLMAAIAAAEGGATVQVLEKLRRPGVKLLATGGGRCNLTNTLGSADFCAAFGRQGRFMRDALNQFSADDLQRFFADCGVPTTVADGFHIFPRSEQATDILRALRERALAAEAQLKTEQEVTSIRRASAPSEDSVKGSVPCRESGWQVKTASGDLFLCDALILACGGRGYPALGGSAIGYELARQLGHHCSPLAPALVGLQTQQSWPGDCTGIVLPQARLWIDEKKYRKQPTTGELLFTHHGISGPAAIDLSGQICTRLQDQETVPVKFSPIPERTRTDWEDLLQQGVKTQPRKSLSAFLAGELPRAIVQALCTTVAEWVNVPPAEVPAIRMAELPRRVRDGLAETLCGWPLTITGHMGWEKAMVTCGGVTLKEIDPKTMASRLSPGIFFAGEMVDLDGPCGGYNLQWAFSSGFLAGQSAANDCAPHSS